MKPFLACIATLLIANTAAAMDDMDGMDMDGHDMPTMDHSAHENHNSMHGFYGAYPMSREGSGTSWVPESSPTEGIHSMQGEWMTMLHGEANLIYNNQGGHRGDEKAYTTSMLMGMASRPVGEGTFGLRAMLSLDPLMGKSGYPLLLQSGETADGVSPLIDRQHPHDAFMELAATYSHPITSDSSAFLYLGYPGEPALGPATFMHRFSGMSIPEAPIDHHWLDSTHITFGVATLGYVYRDWKFEVSSFNGREPDQSRWNFDELQLDSASARVTYNPTPNWSMQVSAGQIHSPEALEQNIDQQRLTASAMYNLPLGRDNWMTTVAWGQNDLDSGPTLNAFLVESAYRYHEDHTFFARAERAEKNELFEAPNPLAGEIFNVGKLSAGYRYDVPLSDHVKLGLGGLASVYDLSDALDSAYGSNPASFMLFGRLALY